MLECWNVRTYDVGEKCKSFSSVLEAHNQNIDRYNTDTTADDCIGMRQVYNCLVFIKRLCVCVSCMITLPESMICR